MDTFARACQILQLWKLMDFTEVDVLPTEARLAGFDRELTTFQGFDVRKFRAEKDGKARGSSGTGAHGAAGTGSHGTAGPDARPPRRTAARTRADFMFRVPLAGPEAQQARHLADLIREVTGLHDAEVFANCHVLLGSVSREACIRAFSLACCGSVADAEDETARPEATAARVPFLELDLDNKGARMPDTTRLSPLVTMLDGLHESSGSADNQAMLDELLGTLSKRVEDDALLTQSTGELTVGDLATLLKRAQGLAGIRETCALLAKAAPQEAGDVGTNAARARTEAAGEQTDKQASEWPIEPVAYISLTLFRDANAAKQAEEEPQGGLGPFYYADLEMVERALADGPAPANAAAADALADVARYACSATLDAPASRLDVLTSAPASLERFYADVLGPASIPHGRWPWPSRFDPALMQQVAINLTLRNVAKRKDPLPDGLDIPDYFSVNGPPGTGKTTMLKDVIAGCVVEKARVLAGFGTPDNAFERVSLAELPGTGLKPDWTFVNSCWRLAGDAVEANDYAILVASSNNAAVENISKELPELSGLLGGLDEKDEALREVRELFTAGGDDPSAFFSGWAQKLHDEQNGAAGKGRGAGGAAEKGKAAGTGHAGTAAAHTASPTLKAKTGWGTSATARPTNDARKPPAPTDVWGLISVPLGKKANIRAFVKAALTNMGWNNGVDKGSAEARYREARTRFLRQYELVSTLLRQLQGVAAATTTQERAWAWEQLSVSADEPCRAIDGVEELVSLLRAGFAEGDEKAKEREQLAVMWAHRVLNRERERLFAYGMDLTTRFVQASNHARHNLRLLAAIWGEKAMRGQDDRAKQNYVRVPFSDADRDAAMPVLLQTLSLAVPVVSTTFAAAGRLLGHVRVPATYGLLIIDEAGQAVPAQAVGTLFRARRALVVGDPKQIEPVVTEESQLIARVFPPELQRDADPRRPCRATWTPRTP